MAAHTHVHAHVFPQANKTLAKATVEAAAINATANVRYDAIKDKYAQFAILLSNAKSVHNLSSEATLTYLANAIVGGGRKQQVACCYTAGASNATFCCVSIVRMLLNLLLFLVITYH